MSKKKKWKRKARWKVIIKRAHEKAKAASEFPTGGLPAFAFNYS